MTLRDRLSAGQLIWAVGVWDPVSATIAEQAGFDAVALQSFQFSVRDVVPDTGVLTPVDLLRDLERVARAVSTPIIVDFEQGFGDVYNTLFWLRRFEDAGMAAMHIDDFDERFRCPFVPPYLPRLRDETEVIRQIEAVKETTENDMVVIARTGAYLCSGIESPAARAEEARRRLKRYEAAGADVIFANPADKAELANLHSVVAAPLMIQPTIDARQDLGDKSADYLRDLDDASVDDLLELGCQVVNEPASLLGVALKAVETAALEQLKARSPFRDASRAFSVAEMKDRFTDQDRLLQTQSRWPPAV